jgi:hypothetical protein
MRIWNNNSAHDVTSTEETPKKSSNATGRYHFTITSTVPVHSEEEKEFTVRPFSFSHSYSHSLILSLPLTHRLSLSLFSLTFSFFDFEIQLYLINVTLPNGETVTILRRFKQFLALHNAVTPLSHSRISTLTLILFILTHQILFMCSFFVL